MIDARLRVGHTFVGDEGMSQQASSSRCAPGVDIKDLNKRKVLESRLFSLDGQLRNFGRIRDRLSAAGKDGTGTFREMQTRRDKIAAELKQFGSGPASTGARDPRLPFQSFDQSLLTLPIASAQYIAETGIFGFGSSGFVQMAPAAEGVNTVITGKFPSTGEISTIPGGPPGAVSFTGDLSVGPDQIPQDQYDPSIDYFWIHNWKYLVPFPPPTTESRFTYRFDVNAAISLFFSGGEGQVLSFVSVGETPNLTTGTDVVVNTDAGWPLNFDLNQQAPEYNGSYGYVLGSVTVQRSFLVGGGHVPGVAVVVGVIAQLSMMAEVKLFFPGLFDSGISVVSENSAGRITYSYEPQLVNAP
ncbi:MAG TPA: hypothetical protein VH640_02650 [Bryobacteraceae bacterium]